jgi:hypothetical protein
MGVQLQSGKPRHERHHAQKALSKSQLVFLPRLVAESASVIFILTTIWCIATKHLIAHRVGLVALVAVARLRGWTRLLLAARGNFMFP